MAVKRMNLPEFLMDKEVKLNFLNELELSGYSISQYNVSCSVLKKIDKYESLIGESCFKFSATGILDMLGSFNSTALSSLKSILSTVRLYIVSANNLLNLTNMSVLNIDAKELEPLVNNRSKEFKYITKQDYLNILKTRNCNYQDLMQIVFLWNGIRGNDYKDLIEFRKQDFTGHSLIYNNAEIELCEQEIAIIKGAIEEESYVYYDRFTNNGERREVKLWDNGFIFKATDHFNSEPMLSSNTLKSRLVGFLNEKLQMPSLTGKGVHISGIMYRCLETNGFIKMRRPDLNRIINDGEQKIGYTTLNAAQEIILEKVNREMA